MSEEQFSAESVSGFSALPIAEASDPRELYELASKIHKGVLAAEMPDTSGWFTYRAIDGRVGKICPDTNEIIYPKQPRRGDGPPQFFPLDGEMQVLPAEWHVEEGAVLDPVALPFSVEPMFPDGSLFSIQAVVSGQEVELFVGENGAAHMKVEGEEAGVIKKDVLDQVTEMLKRAV